MAKQYPNKREFEMLAATVPDFLRGDGHLVKVPDERGFIFRVCRGDSDFDEDLEFTEDEYVSAVKKGYFVAGVPTRKGIDDFHEVNQKRALK